MSATINPSLSRLLPLDSIPHEFEGLQEALEDAFDDIFVKNLIYKITSKGEAGFCSLDLVAYNGIGINIPLDEDLTRQLM